MADDDDSNAEDIQSQLQRESTAAHEQQQQIGDATQSSIRLSSNATSNAVPEHDVAALPSDAISEIASPATSTTVGLVSGLNGAGDDDGDDDAIRASTSATEEPDNKAMELLGSIVKAHTGFDEESEEAEIAALVKVAFGNTPDPAVSPGMGAGTGAGTQSEDEKILLQVKNTVKFLQDNVPAPAAHTSEDSYANAGASDPGFDIRMRVEYEKLYRLFITARRNNQGLVKKLRDLKSEIVSNATKVEAAMHIFQSDRVLIASLKKEVKKAWSVVEMSKDREMKAKETILNLKIEIESLKKDVGYSNSANNGNTGYSGGGTSLAQRNLQLQTRIDQLEKEKSDVQQELEISQSDVRVLNDELKDLGEKLRLEKKNSEQSAREIDAVNGLLQSKKSDQDRELRMREKLEGALAEKKKEIQDRDSKIAQRLSEIKGLKDVINRLEMQVKDEKLKNEKEANEKQAIIARVTRMQEELDAQKQTAFEKSANADLNQTPSPEMEHHFRRYQEEIKKLTKSREIHEKNAKLLQDAKLAAEVERDSAKGLNYSLTRETESLKKQLVASMNQIEMLTKERDATQKNFVKAVGATQRQINAVKISDLAQRTLEHEIEGFKEEASKMRKIIYSLEKERDFHVAEFNKLQEENAMKDEELKMKDLLVFDTRKKISELERKRKEQQQLYESVRTDRNLYSKNLIECEDEIIELKRKLKIMGHQIEQLKEEIAAKETDLAKEHFEHTKLEKEKEGLSSHIAKLQTQLEETQVSIKNRLAEENKLRHVIAEGDAARSKLKKEYDSIVQARDVLCSRIIRRDDEIALLYEKLKIQHSTLKKGENQFYERIEDIRVLKLEIKRLRREKAILQTETQNVDGLRGEIFRLNKDILKERTRVKVLEEELESPLNIHRWRKLSGSDPTMFELIMKIQALQKRLIQKTEEVVEKEKRPEVFEELRVLKSAIKGKVRECKSLASELNMYHSQINEYKFETQRLHQDFQEMKKRYYELKKKDRDERSIRLRFGQETNALLGDQNIVKSSNDDPTVVPSYSAAAKDGLTNVLPALKPHPSKTPRFSGGGFNMDKKISVEGRQEERLGEASV
ncbi:hypothetical protein HDU82_002795 [Entophlyctis luteolus]|nr:hypothetical protein HDU82_002795 [Entophlyctis luteolus]